MSPSAKHLKPTMDSGTNYGIRPGESPDHFEKRVGDDAPAWTEDDFKRGRSIEDFPELKAALERARGQRSPQNSPTKKRVALRLDRNSVDDFRHHGPGRQTAINDALADLVKRNAR